MTLQKLNLRSETGRGLRRMAMGAIFCALGPGMSARAQAPEGPPWSSRALSPVAMERTNAPDFVLLTDGRAACDIVIPASGEHRAYYREVAERLKHFLDAATGESFPIVTAATRPAIFIGPSENPFVRDLYNQSLQQPVESLTVAVFADGIALAGHDAPSPVKEVGPIRLASMLHSRGTFFAVCDFLERMLGFRFYFPGELGLHVPDYRGKTIRLPPVRYTDRPVFSLRTSSYPYYDTMDTDLLGVDTRQRLFWSLMLRPADVFFERSNHTEEKWHETYAESHPEFFALREDGTRQIGDRGIHSAQRCYASEAGFQEHLRLIERSLAGEDVTHLFGAAVTTPNHRYIYWWPSDGYKGCACPECEKRTDRTVPPYAIYSRIIWDYALRLSAAIAERWPGKILKVPIYPYYGSIPEGVEVPPNVALNVVKFGVGRFPAAYFKEPAYWQDALDEVHEINRRSSQKIWIWVHYPHSPRIRDGLAIPYPVPNYMKAFMTRNREAITGLHLNGHQTASFALDGLMVYLWQKLLWNPELDIEVLVDEFSRMWGPAAAELREFYGLLIDRWENTRWEGIPHPHDYNFNMPLDRVWTDTYPPETRARLKALLESAASKTQPGTLAARRAQYFLDGFRPFFEQGERFDRRLEQVANVPRRSLTLADRHAWTGPLSLVDNLSGDAADEKTRLFLGMDDESFFIAGTLLQSTPFRTQFQSKGRDDAIWNNDSFELFLCVNRPGLDEAGLPLTDQYHHVILDVTGSVYDAYREVGAEREDKSVDIDFEWKTELAPNRFDFVMRIPFASLGVSRPTPGTRWRANFYRTKLGDRPDQTRMHAWSPTLSRGFHQPDKFGVLTFDSVGE